LRPKKNDMAYTIDLTKITQFDHVEFVAKQVVEGFITGIHKSPMHGFSVEFAEHRPYNTGEPIRHIDWKPTSFSSSSTRRRPTFAAIW